MEIRKITNDEFLQLAELTIVMYKYIDDGIDSFQAVNTLVHCINTGKDFVALGLFDGTKLIGIVTGLAYNSTTYFFSGIYMTVKNSEHLKELVEKSFAYVKDLGYKAWEVDATSDNIGSIMEKYGAYIKYIRYRKEFD